MCLIIRLCFDCYNITLDEWIADESMIMVPNPTKSRAFSLDEMIAATQTFTQEIGRGGFGSVFFGKLPEGTNIAVKVLSLFSRQGAQEFLNEVTQIFIQLVIILFTLDLI